VTSNQPVYGHGGNAKIDEEVTIMVSKAIASLDAWLEQAEAVLTEQREVGLSPSQVAPEPEEEEIVLSLRSLDSLRCTSVRLQDTDEQEENESHDDEADNNGA
jgi:hypothetical protein